jgi:hypothetical protein
MKKLLCVIAVLGVTAIAATPAQAAKKHHLDATVKTANIGSTGSPPVSGSAQYAGSIMSSIGSGAVLGQNFFGPVFGTFHGPVQAFLTKGTVKGTLEGSGAPKPDGSIGFSGTGTITKGTGKYKGAKGKFTFEGSEPAGMTVITFTLTGSVKF